jgi:phage FluMu protein Com
MEMKPRITLEEISYKPEHSADEREYPVYVIDGALNPPYTQGYIHCTGCGTGNHFRWLQDTSWVVIKCPKCNAVSAWYEEYDGDEDDES